MKTINIKGKEYITVNERVKAFRKDYPDWQMTDEIVSFSDTFILIKTTISTPEGTPVATGIAQEFRDASNINKTSYVENCETSAWGRALANFGIGIDTSVASADEMASALDRQERSKEKIDKNAADALKMKAAEKGVEMEKILETYGAADTHELTTEQWMNAMRRLDKN